MLRNINAVLKRELKQMFSRPIYLFGSVFTMLFCSVFFLSLLNNGVPEKIPVGLIDHDNSSLSRRFYREMNATQGVEVLYYANYQEARTAIQSGEIFGFIELPKDLYAAILTNKRPEIGVYTTQAYMVPGTFAYKTFLTLSNMASGAYQQEVLKAKGKTENEIMGLIRPITIDSHPIGNPWNSYAVYLVNVILPGILQLCVLVLTIFSIGYELKQKTSREWLATAKHSTIAALIGKSIPYSILFIVLGLATNVLLYKVMNFPLQGSIWTLFLATIMLVVAAQAVGIFMIGLFPVLRDGISFSAVYGILSISLAGMTFPLEYMPGPVQAIGQVFPLRHYYLIYVHEGMLGGGFASCWIHFVALLAFLILPFIVIKRLEKAMIYQNYPTK